MGVDFRQQGLSRMTCRLCTARHMPCRNFDLKSAKCVLRRGDARRQLCVTWRGIGAGAGRAHRSGACRAATKRVHRPASVGGARSLPLCACAVLCLHWRTTHARRRDMNERASVDTPDMSAFWMPFTANRQFKSAPGLLASAKGIGACDRSCGGFRDD